MAKTNSRTGAASAATQRRARPQTPTKRPNLRVVKEDRLKERKVKPPTVDDDVRRWAQCRALGHSWVHKGPVDGEAQPPMGFFNAVGVRSICAYCKTERIKWLGRYGSLGTTTYRNYPDGYSRHGDQRLSNSDWRHTWIVTALN